KYGAQRGRWGTALSCRDRARVVRHPSGNLRVLESAGELVRSCRARSVRAELVPCTVRAGYGGTSSRGSSACRGGRGGLCARCRTSHVGDAAGRRARTFVPSS